MARGGIGARAFRSILALSLALTAISTGGLFFLRYRSQRSSIESEISTMRLAQTPALVSALWAVDLEQLGALVRGMRYFPYISFVAILDESGVAASAGELLKDEPVDRFDLVIEREGRSINLGSLELQADRDRILADVVAQILTSLGLQAMLLLVESLFILFAFQKLVTRHLSRIAEYMKSSWEDPGRDRLSLDKTDRGDELDVLAASFNELRERLEASRIAERRVMDELRQSEERYRALVEEAPDAILVFDFDTKRFIECNSRALELFGKDRDFIFSHELAELYAPDQPDGRSIAESSTDNDLRALAGESIVARRHVLNGRGGVMVCELRLSRFPAPGRRLIRSSYLDITDRVRAEEATARSLREKEVLLQEVYHRTKNNMEVIASLLDLQTMFSPGEEIRRVMKDMNARIRSMALVHQRLYESQDLSRIDLSGYLGELVSGIKAGYLRDRKDVELELDIEEGIVALLDTAIPCGLALTELVVNAARHAFPTSRGKGGRIEVRLERVGEGRLRVQVRDDGIGLPQGFDPRRDGRIGLRTATSLIEQQLRGSLILEAREGTSWKAVFRDDLYGARI